MKSKLIIPMLFLVGATTIGCATYTNKAISFENTATFKSLNKVTYPDIDTEFTEVNIEDIESINQFAYRTSNAIIDSGANYIYSPLSLYIALSMLGEGISTEIAMNQMDSLLGNDASTRQEAIGNIYSNDYYSNSNGTLKLANSMWVDNCFEVPEDYCNTLSNKYCAEIYNTDFDEVGHENIVKWINYYTNDFLGLTKENYYVDPNLVVLLLNTIYFDNKWKLEFDRNHTASRDFYLQDGTTVSADFMTHIVDSTWYEGSTYVMATDSFKNESSVTYILPNEGTNLTDVLNDPSIYTVPATSENTQVEIDVPKFNYYSDFNLNDSLIGLGLVDVFSAGALAKIGSESLYVEYIKQNAGIKFSEEGVKAAAVTSIGITETAAPLYNSIVLNRPFIYIIKDKAGVPLFVGTIQNPSE